MISLIVNSRKKGNPNSNLRGLLDSLRDRGDPSRLEVLIKFDEDDEIPGYIGNYPFKVKALVEPRYRGYTDIHIGYGDLAGMIDDRTTIVGAVGDDFFCINDDWMDLVFNAKGDIIHTRPHPRMTYPAGIYPPNFKTDTPFDVSFDIDQMDELYVVDENPFWSRKLLDLCDYNFLISFSDAWTLALEKVLWDEYQVNKTSFIPKIFHRETYVGDKIADPQWAGDRKVNFYIIRSGWFKILIKRQAQRIKEGL